MYIFVPTKTQKQETMAHRSNTVPRKRKKAKKRKLTPKKKLKPGHVRSGFLFIFVYETPQHTFLLLL